MSIINELSERHRFALKFRKHYQEVPSDEARKTLASMGYSEQECSNWGYYIYDVAYERDVPLRVALAMFMTLGPNEAFDGFIMALDDYVDQTDQWSET